jgi:hypothetical protein
LSIEIGIAIAIGIEIDPDSDSDRNRFMAYLGGAAGPAGRLFRAPVYRR